MASPFHFRFVLEILLVDMTVIDTLILLKKSLFRNPRPRSCERGYKYHRLTRSCRRVRKNVGIFQRNHTLRSDLEAHIVPLPRPAGIFA